jgi:hypothetical protein
MVLRSRSLSLDEVTDNTCSSGMSDETSSDIIIKKVWRIKYCLVNMIMIIFIF